MLNAQTATATRGLSSAYYIWSVMCDWWEIREEAIDLVNEAQTLLDTKKSDAEDALNLFQSLEDAQKALRIANKHLGLS